MHSKNNQINIKNKDKDIGDGSNQQKFGEAMRSNTGQIADLTMQKP